MKSEPKTIKIFIIVLIVLAVICTCVFSIFALFPPKVSKITMEKELIENKKAIISVIDYFKEVPYETTVIWGADIDIDIKIDLTVYDNGKADHLTVEDANAANNIYLLLKEYNYKKITKKGDTIIFSRWADLDSGTGIVYSIDGHTPDESSFDCLTKLEPLGEENWYYYEEDFNEWKRRNSQ